MLGQSIWAILRDRVRWREFENEMARIRLLIIWKFAPSIQISNNDTRLVPKISNSEWNTKWFLDSIRNTPKALMPSSPAFFFRFFFISFQFFFLFSCFLVFLLLLLLLHLLLLLRSTGMRRTENHFLLEIASFSVTISYWVGQ